MVNNQTILTIKPSNKMKPNNISKLLEIIR